MGRGVEGICEKEVEEENRIERKTCFFVFCSPLTSIKKAGAEAKVSRIAERSGATEGLSLTPAGAEAKMAEWGGAN
jgi:hypothetical protein